MRTPALFPIPALIGLLLNLTPALATLPAAEAARPPFEIMASGLEPLGTGTPESNLIAGDFLVFDAIAFTSYLGNEAAGEVLNYEAAHPDNTVLKSGSHSFLSASQLDLLQPNRSYSLARIQFSGLDDGSDEIHAITIATDHASGSTSQSDMVRDTSREMDPVPLPGAFWLLASALAGLTGKLVRRSRGI